VSIEIVSVGIKLDLSSSEMRKKHKNKSMH